MFINKECELHDMLGLHETANGKCSCGIIIRHGKPLLPEKVNYATMLVGEDVLRRLATGTLTDRDEIALRRIRAADDDVYSLSDECIGRLAESAQAQFLDVAIELYAKTEFSVGDAVLRDPSSLALAEARWKANNLIRIQAKAPISLGWNFIAETDHNVTSGNKARIYERDGVIAIQHAQYLQPLSAWRMRCRQLFELLGKVCTKASVVPQLHPRTAKFALKFLVK